MKMKMKHLKLMLLTTAMLSLLCSCMSTRVYVKTQELLYEDDTLSVESNTLTRDGNVMESSTKTYYDLADAYMAVQTDDTNVVAQSFTAVKVATSKSQYEEVTFTLVESTLNKRTDEFTTSVLGTKTVQIKDGAIVPYSNGDGEKVIAKGDTLPDEAEEAFKKLPDYVLGLASKTDTIEEGSGKNYRTVTNVESVQVDSTPNKSFITYCALGKIPVIAGVTAWNVLKCAGYALINFAGGYNTVTGNTSGGKMWMMPDWKKAKTKAAEARAANAIQYYPEYHLPFTNNHITVTTINSETDAAFTDHEKVNITSETTVEYDNTMNVELSAKSDAASTAAVAGMIGTGVTIPVSVITWVGGAVAGVAGQMQR